jgi:hypothetical protein
LFFLKKGSNFINIYGEIFMFKKFLLVFSVLILVAACGGSGGSSSSGSAEASGADGAGGAAQGYQVPGSFQPVDSEG